MKVGVLPSGVEPGFLLGVVAGIEFPVTVPISEVSGRRHMQGFLVSGDGSVTR